MGRLFLTVAGSQMQRIKPIADRANSLLIPSLLAELQVIKTLFGAMLVSLPHAAHLAPCFVLLRGNYGDD